MSNRSLARWLVSLPALLVGSMLFWTMALGSGALSLLAVAGLSEGSPVVQMGEVPPPTATEPMPGQPVGAAGYPERSILVHLQESAEPEDVNDNLGAVAPGQADQTDQADDDGTGQMSGRAAAPAPSDPN
jgi:hypothetical protein